MKSMAFVAPTLLFSLVAAVPAAPTAARGPEVSDMAIAASDTDRRTREVGLDVFPFASLDPGSDADAVGTYGAGSIWTMRDATRGEEPYYATSNGVTLLDDINPYGDSEVDHGLEHQGYFYFDANDGVHGEELWRTDGTTTELFADINPGGSSDPEPLLSIGDTLYLSAITTDTGRELFRLVDGDVELVADTYPGPEDGSPELVAFGDLFAVEYTNASGTQFNLFDGTNLVNLPTAAAAYSITSIREFMGLGDRLYIIADNAADGREVYSTNGTDFRQHEVNGSGTSSARYLTALGDVVVFRADDGTHGEELFVLDVATSDTPALTGDINSTGSDGSSPAYLAALGDTVYFRATDGSGYEPWSYTPGSAPQRVADINPGGATTLIEFVGTQDLAYFPANDGSGWKLFEDRSGVVSDVIASTTPTPSVEYGAARRDIIPTSDGTAIVFVGTTDDEGSELWWADADGVRPLGDVQTEYNTSDHEYLTVLGTIGDTTVIAADDGTGTYSYQWYAITDGVATAIPGTAAIAGDALGSWTAWNDTIVAGSGRSIWVYDGTTIDEYTISPAATNAGAYGFVPHGDRLYFAADDQSSGVELWSFDGSAVAQVADIAPGGDSSNPTELHSHGGYLYFAANNGTDGRELYRYDGITAPTATPFFDIAEFGTSVPEFLASYGDELLFVADDGTNGAEPWVVRADGTVEMLENLDGAASDSIPSVTEFVTARGNAYFYSFDASAQVATLWEYDGTDVTEVETFPTYPTIPMVAVDDDLIFLALDAVEGRELHRIGTDGVELISDLEPGTDGTGYIELVEVDGQIRINDGIRLMSYTQADGLEVVARFIGDPVSYFVTLNDEPVGLGLSTGPYSAEAAELGFVPDAPSNLTVDGTGDTATITWAAPTDAGSADVTDYDVTATGGTLDCDETARECTWTGLDPTDPDTVSVTASNRFGTSKAATASSSGEVFITVTPGRVVDTRFTGTKVDGVERFKIAGAEVVGDPARSGESIGVPIGADAVAINLTVTGTEAPGFVSVYPCDATSDAKPNVSNVNYVAGATVANSAVVPLSDDGYLCVGAEGATHVLVDVAGYFVAGLTTVDPGRVVDTRFSTSKVDGTERFKIAEATVIGDPARTGDSIGVPVGASAVALNLTVTGTEAPGFVSVYPCDATTDTTPNVSNVNYAANATVANSAVVPLSDDGYLCVTSVGATHVLIDVAGYFVSGLTTVNPGRVVDTRFGDPKVDGVTRFQIAGAEVVGDPARIGESIGVPVNATAVAINVTVTGTEAPGFVSVYPCASESTTPPNVSNVNYEAGATVANSAVVPLSADGHLCVKAEGATHVLIDVAGHL